MKIKAKIAKISDIQQLVLFNNTVSHLNDPDPVVLIAVVIHYGHVIVPNV